MARKNIRAVAILVNNDQILLIHRTHDGKEFWVLPGGGVEEKEKIEEAVVREVEEEASIECKIVKLLYSHIYSDLGHKQFYYLCKHISGNPKLGEYNEFQTMKEENQTYEPVWVKISKLKKILLYPLEIRDWIIDDFRNSFSGKPKSLTIKTTKLRQQI
ncbi:NUDIX domain-containing protein [Patescibacteria group bacterium]|nr:NUDIX domain-containing protein [Patescibacteria group bacterium]